MIEYHIARGELDVSGVVAEAAYSGDPAHKNDPGAVGDRDEGPLPEGTYQLGTPFDAPDTGPLSIPLTQIQGESFGRSGFRLHGDSLEHPGAASRGCIVTSCAARELCARDPDQLLKVSAE